MSTKRLSGRRKLIVASVATALLASFGVMSALAVHDLQFQLDGNTAVDAGSPPFDWDSLFDAAGAPKALPTDFTSSGFSRDFRAQPGCSLTATGTFCTADQTTFSTGSKDTLPITPGWQCNFDNNVNSKIDVMNSYAAAYTAPATITGIVNKGDQILYFGMERNTNTGDANVAFWFLQNKVGCVAASGSQAFTGDHADGDLLVVSAFTKGGGVSTIDVYRWDGGANGSLNPTSKAHGVDCKTTSGGDAVCATTNSGPNAITGTINTQWLTANFKDGVGTKLQAAEFFEGGLNLTAKGLGGKCFNEFIGDTRSSQSLTATLFDYAEGSLGSCGITVTTTPSIGSNSSCVLPCTGITDTADISGTNSGGGAGPTPTGTVQFYLCGPGVTTCASGGAPIPSDPAAKVTLGACDPVAAGHACATSADASSAITTVGTYCFRAVYDPGTDPNYVGLGGSFTSAGECFTVTGVATLLTNQNWVPNDSATITGPTDLSGTATFTLYNDATCGTSGGTAIYSPAGVPVSGTSPQTVHTSNVDTVVVVEAGSGDYSWKVSYSDAVLSAPADVCEKTTITITD
jgi:hypothetical protein